MVNGTLTDDGDLLLNGRTVTLGAAGSLVETPGNTAIGLVKSTRSAAQGVDQSFGGIGLTLNAAGASPGVTSVTRITGVAQTGGSNSSILRAFDITPALNAGLDARVDFFYDDSERAGQDVNPSDVEINGRRLHVECGIEFRQPRTTPCPRSWRRIVFEILRLRCYASARRRWTSLFVPGQMEYGFTPARRR